MYLYISIYEFLIGVFPPPPFISRALILGLVTVIISGELISEAEVARKSIPSHSLRIIAAGGAR